MFYENPTTRKSPEIKINNVNKEDLFLPNTSSRSNSSLFKLAVFFGNPKKYINALLRIESLTKERLTEYLHITLRVGVQFA